MVFIFAFKSHNIQPRQYIKLVTIIKSNNLVWTLNWVSLCLTILCTRWLVLWKPADMTLLVFKTHVFKIVVFPSFIASSASRSQISTSFGDLLFGCDFGAFPMVDSPLVDCSWTSENKTISSNLVLHAPSASHYAQISSLEYGNSILE